MNVTLTAEEVAIIIPVYNDAIGIALTLNTLIQGCPPGGKIVVVDNCSSDETVRAVLQYDDPRVHLVSEQGTQSSYAARNRGINAIKAPIYMFLDADVVVPRDFVSQALMKFAQSDADYIGYHVDVVTMGVTTPVSRYEEHAGFPVEQYMKDMQFAPTCCMAVRSNVLQEIGPFDARMTSGGDREFGSRVHQAGFIQSYDSNNKIYHPSRNDLMDLLAKNKRVGQGLCQLQWFYPDRFGRAGMPPYPRRLKSGYSGELPSEPLRYTIIFAIALLARLIGYYTELLGKVCQFAADTSVGGIPNGK
jgi:glycosyltransferase involved in cell wall biosynthesis